jgi:hypothetical protein
MALKKGDRVKFLNDIGQGEIIGFKDSKFAVVINDDGFEMPVLITELIKIDSKYDMADSELTNNKNDDEDFVSNNKKKAEKEEIKVEDFSSDGLLTDKKAR